MNKSRERVQGLLNEVLETKDFGLMAILADLMEEEGDWRYEGFRWAAHHQRKPIFGGCWTRQSAFPGHQEGDELPDNVFYALPKGRDHDNTSRLWRVNTGTKLPTAGEPLMAYEALCEAISTLKRKESLETADSTRQ